MKRKVKDFLAGDKSDQKKLVNFHHSGSCLTICHPSPGSSVLQSSGLHRG